MKKALPIFAVMCVCAGCTLEEARIGQICPPLDADTNAKAYVYSNGTASPIADRRCPDEATQCQKYTSQGDYPDQYFCRMPCDGKTLLCDGDCIPIADATPECRALYPNISDDGTEIELLCTPGETRCVDGLFSTCLGTTWDKIVCQTGKCAEGGKTCKLNADQTCTPNHQSCNSTATAIITCDSEGKSLDTIPCTNGRCTTAQGKVECRANTVCEANTSQCSDDHRSIVTCNNDGTATSSQACLSDSPICEIIESAPKCVPETAETHCTTGHHTCSTDLDYVLECQSNGTWTEQQRCDNKCDTSTTRCAAVVEKCKSTENKCIDNAMHTCNDDGSWTIKPCEDPKPICDSYGKACVKCKLDTKFCSQNTMYTCNDDGRLISVPCPSDIPVCDAEGRKCVEKPIEQECKPNIDYCTGEGRSAGIYHCTSKGQKGDLVEYCSAEGCNDLGTACASSATEKCVPGTSRCVDDHQATEYCDSTETWTNRKTCSSGLKCYDSTGKCMICDPGSVRCNTAHSGTEVCDELGEWITDEPCVEGQSCLDDYKKCMACVPGSSFCREAGKSTGIYVCAEDGSSATLQSNCKACNSDYTDCAEPTACTPGERKCVNMNPMKCNNEGEWEAGMQCSRNQYCNEAVGSVCIPRRTSTQGVCTDGDSFCSGPNRMVCKDGLYMIEDSCSTLIDSETAYCFTYYSSTTQNYVAECQNTCGDHQEDSYCIQATVYTCKDNTPVAESCKNGDDFCELESSTSLFDKKPMLKAKCTEYVCTEGEYKCSGTSLSVCHNNQWIMLVDCGAGKLTCYANGSQGKCIEK